MRKRPPLKRCWKCAVWEVFSQLGNGTEKHGLSGNLWPPDEVECLDDYACMRRRSMKMGKPPVSKHVTVTL